MLEASDPALALRSAAADATIAVLRT